MIARGPSRITASHDGRVWRIKRMRSSNSDCLYWILNLRCIDKTDDELDESGDERIDHHHLKSLTD